MLTIYITWYPRSINNLVSIRWIYPLINPPHSLPPSLLSLPHLLTHTLPHPLASPPLLTSVSPLEPLTLDWRGREARRRSASIPISGFLRLLGHVFTPGSILAGLPCLAGLNFLVFLSPFSLLLLLLLFFRHVLMIILL